MVSLSVECAEAWPIRRRMISTLTSWKLEFKRQWRLIISIGYKTKRNSEQSNKKDRMMSSSESVIIAKLVYTCKCTQILLSLCYWLTEKYLAYGQWAVVRIPSGTLGVSGRASHHNPSCAPKTSSQQKLISGFLQGYGDFNRHEFITCMFIFNVLQRDSGCGSSETSW